MDQETYVPGMAPKTKQAEQQQATQVPDSMIGGFRHDAGVNKGAGKGKNQGSPVAGFLYSLSNGGQAEYWPIRMGVNSIGSGADNDIVLNEASVSEHHAVINVKRNQRNGRFVAGIKDAGSSNGVLLNGEDLDFEMHNCANESIIQVGYNYRLLFLLVDPEKFELKAAEDFQETNVEAEPLYSPKAPQFPYSSPASNVYSGDETVNINGGPNISGGHTQIL